MLAKTKTILSLSLIVSLAFIGCTNDTTERQAPINNYFNFDKVPSEKQDITVKAPPVKEEVSKDPIVIEDSPTQQDPLYGSDVAKVKLHKSALNTEFLLQGQIVRQAQIPMFSNMKSRIVYFLQSHNQILMLEASEGHLVTKDLPQSLIIASFDIISDNGEFVSFDFNQGMNKVFHVSDWRGNEGAPDYNKEFKTAEVKNSFIDKAYFSNNDEFVIKQVALVADSGFNTPYVLKYYLSLHKENLSFKPTKAPANYDKFAFFQIAPQYLLDGNTVSYASKHDVSKAVTYAVSANTPKEFKQAVKDGVLYWNKALGRDVFKAIDAPEGVSAPNPNYNVVQWVNWDQAGFAYADAQMNPRTGEITHAQVFMTSVFAVSSLARAKSYLEKLKKQKPEQRLFVAGLEQKPLCNAFAKSEPYQNALRQLVEMEASDLQVLEVSRDYIREVMAHEIGHTMGLRHNFAASMATNIKESERESTFKKYIVSMDAPEGVIPSNSVMEYNNFYEASLMGDIIEKNAEALDYDTKVIQYLYDGKVPASWPLYCTDDHTAAYSDCNRFDTGSNLAEHIKLADQNTIQGLPLRLINNFGRAKAEKKDLELISISPKSMVDRIKTDQQLLYKLLSQQALHLKSFRSYKLVDSLNIKNVQKTQQLAVIEMIKVAGGSDNFTEALLNVFPVIESHMHGPLYHGMVDMLDSGKYDTWTSKNGDVVNFTEEDKNIMKTKAHAYFEALEKQLVLLDIANVTSLTFEDNMLTENMIEFLNHKLQKYVLELKGDEHLAEPETSNKYSFQIDEVLYEGELKVFARDTEIRKAASQLLASTRAKIPGWAQAERFINAKKYNELFKSSFKDSKIPDLNRPEVPQSVRRWILENTGIGAGLAM
ncbi:MAG: hypothetical protein HOO06_10470 [Bdellovibrionaceae bacterium]|nr:hypothetical protein [Pseudobdellovibrionaceae bacterium]